MAHRCSNAVISIRFDSEYRVLSLTLIVTSGYYDTLISLYKHLGISFRKTDFSYSFSRLIPETVYAPRKITTDVIYNGNSGIAGMSIPSSMRLNEKVLSSIHAAASGAHAYGIFTLMCFKLLILYIRVLFLSIPIFRPQGVEEMTFRTWSASTTPRGFIAQCTMLDLAWVEFTQDLLVPLFSAVCTAPESNVYDHPVEEFLGRLFSVSQMTLYQTLSIVRLHMVNIGVPPLCGAQWCPRGCFETHCWRSARTFIITYIEHPNES